MKELTVTCPLCKSSNLETQEAIAVKDVISEYRTKFRIDVSLNFINIDQIYYRHCKSCDLYFFDPACPGDQSFYEKFQKFPWYYPTTKNEFEFAASHIKSNDKVLEIGSGKGAFAQFLKSNQYTGLEFSENAIAIAKSNGILVLNESIESHSNQHNSYYDTVCTFQVLEHVKDTHGFLMSSVNSLKKGGTLILSVPSYDSFSRLVSNFELDMPPHHVSRWTDQALLNICNFFPLRNESIWHEPLQETHHHFYSYAVNYEILSKLFRIKPKVVHQSIKTKFLHKLSWKLASLTSEIFPHKALHSRGISVTAIYTKL
jgi:2-polyprenyl-3-methyl-5-hydroxy-6-metoxy-1,4-benzoquinol methylase